MRMLERKLGKTEAQILAEATNETGDWPGGTGELQQSLGTQISIANAIIRHFGEKRPLSLTRDVIEGFLRVRSRKNISNLMDSDIPFQRENITIVYDIYEE